MTINKLYIVFYFTAIVFFIALISNSCTRELNADFGAELIQNSSNLVLRDTIIEVKTENIFDTDTFFIASMSPIPLGKITNDNIFGNKEAEIYFEYVPVITQYPFLHYDKSKIYVDSVILKIYVSGAYGNMDEKLDLQVHELITKLPPYNRNLDSRLTNTQYFYDTKILGEKSISYNEITKQTFFYNYNIKALDSSTNIIRMKLDNGIGEKLVNIDSLSYTNDSLFLQVVRGLAITPSPNSAQTLLYPLINNTSSTEERIQLDVYYRSDRSEESTIQDTAIANFIFTEDFAGLINYTNWDNTNSEIMKHLNREQVNEPEPIFIQTNPRTYVRIKIPFFDDMAGKWQRNISRAELVIQKELSSNDLSNIYAPPNVLSLVELDSITNIIHFSPLEYEVSLLSPLEAQLNHIGGRAIYNSEDRNQVSYRLNMSRYAHQVLSENIENKDLLLYSPVYLQYFNIPSIANSYTIQNNYFSSRLYLDPNNNNNDKIFLRIFYTN